MNDPYRAVKEHFAEIDGVVVNEGKGAQGMKIGKKMFVMFHKGELLVKLPPDRVLEVVEKGDGRLFDPGTGKPMKDRVLIPNTKTDLWIQYCDEARIYQESL